MKTKNKNKNKKNKNKNKTKQNKTTNGETDELMESPAVLSQETPRTRSDAFVK